MLKISIQDDHDRATLKLEGKVVGPWATELNRVWGTFRPSLGMKRLCLDMRGVTFVDKDGIKTLRKILRRTNAEILADDPLTRQFVAASLRKPPQSKKEF